MSPAPTDRDHPQNCLCSLLPTARGTGSCGAAGNCRKPAQLSPPRPGWQLSDLLLIEGSAQSWANTETAPAPPAHTPHKAAGPGDVLHPQGISDFKLLGAGQPRPDFSGDLVHGSHDAGTWQQGAGLQLGAAHTMAASQQERSEDAAKCSRGRKPPAAPSVLPKAGKTQLWVFLLQPYPSGHLFQVGFLL